jgi:hypothetical protein
MRLFSCDFCGQPVHFENRSCVNCGHRLAFVPESLSMQALVPQGELDWPLVAQPSQSVRFCANAALDICNWSVPTHSAALFCPACSHNRLVPDASNETGLSRWRRISQAQRHLFYSLLRWKLPLSTRAEDPAGGLVFDFLVDEIASDGRIVPAMTGHEEGLIAIRAAEADDLTREQARSEMNEPYRTLLGHFRHEVGHFIWNRLVRDQNRFAAFRTVFGDERDDYQQALLRHYGQGPASGTANGWQQDFISAYAASHPWEDFAECFAHYLHIVDTLETARSFGIAIEPRGHEEMAAEVAFDPYRARSAAQLVHAWVPFSVALNSIHRSMGQGDLYPFILTPAVVAKLQFVHDLVHGAVEEDHQRLAG